MWDSFKVIRSTRPVHYTGDVSIFQVLSAFSDVCGRAGGRGALWLLWQRKEPSELENQYFNSAVDGIIAYHSKRRFLVLLQVQSSNACGSVFLIGLTANKEALFQISGPKWHAVPGCCCGTKETRG